MSRTVEMSEALYDVLHRALYGNKLTRTHLARHLDVAPSTVKRWFDEDRLPGWFDGTGRNGTDVLVEGVATLTGVSATHLWAVAVRHWEEVLTNGTDRLRPVVTTAADRDRLYELDAVAA